MWVAPIPADALFLAHWVTEYRAKKSFPSTLNDGMPYGSARVAKFSPPDAKFLWVEIAHWLLLITNTNLSTIISLSTFSHFFKLQVRDEIYPFKQFSGITNFWPVLCIVKSKIPEKPKVTWLYCIGLHMVFKFGVMFL